jgi:hypothetical protein
MIVQEKKREEPGSKAIVMIDADDVIIQNE